jgi:molybdenum cofactor biosynthesis enzyme
VLAHAIDDQHGGFGIGRREHRAGGMTAMVIEALDLVARHEELLGQLIEHPQLAAQLAGQRARELLPGPRQPA